jgi:hypothetical protein
MKMNHLCSLVLARNQFGYGHVCLRSFKYREATCASVCEVCRQEFWTIEALQLMPAPLNSTRWPEEYREGIRRYLQRFFIYIDEARELLGQTHVPQFAKEGDGDPQAAVRCVRRRLF